MSGSSPLAFATEPHPAPTPPDQRAAVLRDPGFGRVFTDHCIQRFMDGKLDEVDAAMAKMWLSNLHCKVADECLQLFGGLGYMWEVPIARLWADARMARIAGGSVETMKHLIGRSLVQS